MSHILRFFVRVFRRVSRYVKLKRKRRVVRLKDTDSIYSSTDYYYDQEITDQERRG